MSVIDHPTPSTALPLVAGERLDRATFHNRYEQMPPSTRAELVGGIGQRLDRATFHERYEQTWRSWPRRGNVTSKVEPDRSKIRVPPAPPCPCLPPARQVVSAVRPTSVL
ncbi:MAG TPA: hypothetical protein VGX76_17250, partial [Pirellulales bacterium]|nr:hypothetical protein [Pirellulales bacterium]